MTEVMQMRHRATPAVPDEALVGALRRNVYLMAFSNVAAAAGLGFFDPGTSPSLTFLAGVAPLPVWAVPFAAAGIAQIVLVDRPLIGHTIAVPLWIMLSIGAVIGLVSGLSTAPAASVIYSGLTLYSAGIHVTAMVWRRRQARDRHVKH